MTRCGTTFQRRIYIPEVVVDGVPIRAAHYRRTSVRCDAPSGHPGGHVAERRTYAVIWRNDR